MKFARALGMAWNRMGDAGKTFVFIVGLVAVAIVAWKGLTMFAAHVEQSQAAAGVARKAAERQAARDEWNTQKDKIKGDIEAAIREGRTFDVKRLVHKYSEAAGADLDDARRHIKIADQLAFLATIPRDQIDSRRNAIRQLTLLDPGNQAYALQLSGLNSEIAVREKRIEAERRHALRLDVEERKRQGVRAGMTQQDVLLSSWGRPERVNKTAFAGGQVREQWVYGSGNYLYFENGVLTTIQTSR